jgi:hypothetical protein
VKTTFKIWLSGSLIALALALPLSAQAGKIVVNHDEWTTTDVGFSTGAGINDPGIFMDNVVRWFTGGGVGTVHAYSTNFAYTGSSLAGALSGAGHTYTHNGTTPTTFDLATLLSFDGIFLGGAKPLASISDYTEILIDYVDMGGNVYLSGGTGTIPGGSVGEADAWDPFLNNFGLDYASTYNGISGSRAISNPHDIFADVDHLFENNGNSITDMFPADPRNQILVTAGPDGPGLYAIWDSSLAVPEPETVLLLGFGLLVLSLRARRRA